MRSVKWALIRAAWTFTLTMFVIGIIMAIIAPEDIPFDEQTVAIGFFLCTLILSSIAYVSACTNKKD